MSNPKSKHRVIMINTKKLRDMTVEEMALFYCPYSWGEVFYGLKDEFKDLSTILHKISDEKIGEKNSWIYFPRKPDLFRAFHYCPFSKVKVVILGQDPYPGMQNGKPEACGMSFSVRKGFTVPRSLVNIYDEIDRNYPLANGEKKSDRKSGDLTGLAEQGVLFLNAALVFIPEVGDEEETEAVKKKKKDQMRNVCSSVVSRVISDVSRKKKVVFMLWGMDAMKSYKHISTTGNLLLQSSHPSPFSYQSGDQPFEGCEHFKKANDFLRGVGIDEIDWHARSLK
jgi:uracil-DNA glycosylase